MGNVAVVVLYSTILFLLEEPCHQAPGRLDGPNNVSGAHTEKERS